MFNRIFIRFIGGIVSVVSFVFGDHNAHADISTDQHALLAVESRGAAADWACIPLKNGKNDDFECTHDVSDSQTDVVVKSDIDSFYEYVNSDGDHNSCGPREHNGNSTEYLGSWMCFCNATGLCAPTGYLSGNNFKPYSSGSGNGGYYSYEDDTYYSMEQWKAGVKSIAGTGAGTVSEVTGCWGGSCGGTTGWGSFLSEANNESVVHELRFPAEKIAVKWIGCTDNYWTPGGMEAEVEFTVTSLMHNNSLGYADHTLKGLLSNKQVGPTGSETSVIDAWKCEFPCPGGGAATVPSISGATYSEKDDYTTGFACKANLYYGDDSGDFVLTGCNYGL